jgi:TorA maturation chaperone TorD
VTAQAIRLSEIDALEAARADLYALFSATLGAAPSPDLLGRLARLTGDDTPIGATLGQLGRAAAAAEPEAVARDHFDIFIGVGRGELLPYASYYQTGFLNERPLAAVRADLAALGIERAEGLHDPEDHIAILCGAMSDMAARGWRGGAAAPSQALFFQRHLAPWAGRFFADLSRIRASGFYPALGAVGAAFMAVEAEAFALGEE